MQIQLSKSQHAQYAQSFLLSIYVRVENKGRLNQLPKLEVAGSIPVTRSTSQRFRMTLLHRTKTVNPFVELPVPKKGTRAVSPYYIAVRRSCSVSRALAFGNEADQISWTVRYTARCDLRLIFRLVSDRCVVKIRPEELQQTGHNKNGY